MNIHAATHFSKQPLGDVLTPQHVMMNEHKANGHMSGTAKTRSKFRETMSTIWSRCQQRQRLVRLLPNAEAEDTDPDFVRYT